MAYIATHLTVTGIARLSKIAQDTYADRPDRAVYVMPAVKATVTESGRLGLDRRDSSDSRRRRWAIAYLTMCVLYGVPADAVWLPCYICGDVFDAWHLDADHVNADGMSDPGNLALACASCNSLEKAARPVHPNVEAAIMAAGTGVGYVCGGKGVRSIFDARTRREAGGNFRGKRA